MSKELRFPDPGPDAEIARALRPLLTPPSDTAVYWQSMQRRVMARVALAGAQTWWSVSPRMARAGLVAAGLAILALGALAMQTREIETRMAYQSVSETELEVARIIRGVDEPFPGAPSQASRR